MDGSLAAATSLRMRNLLQRTYQLNSNDTNSALFEELFLGVPAPPPLEISDDEIAPVDESEPSDIQSANTSQAPEKKSSDDEDQELFESDENFAQAPLNLTQIISQQTVPNRAQDDTSLNTISTTEQVASTNGSENPNASTTHLAIDQPSEIPIDSRSTLEPLQSADTSLPDAAKEAAVEKVLQTPVTTSRESLRSRKTNPKSEAAPTGPASVPSSAKSEGIADKPNERATTSSEEFNNKDPLLDLADNAIDSEPVDNTNRRDKWYQDERNSIYNEGDVLLDDDSSASDSSLLERHGQPGGSDAVAVPTASSSTQDEGLNVPDVSATGSNDVGGVASNMDASLLAVVATQAAVPTNGPASLNSTIERVVASSSSVASTGPSTSQMSTGAGSIQGQERSPATSTGESDKDVRQLSQQERVRLVQRVARSFSRLGADGGQLSLKLHPPQLGALNLTVRMEGHTLSARMLTESVEARDAILENLPVLRERLAEQGVEIDRFQVEVNTSNDQAANTASQEQSPFASDSNQSPWTRSSVDYRRVSRDATSGAGANHAFTDVHESNDWQTRIATDRTMDVRA